MEISEYFSLYRKIMQDGKGQMLQNEKIVKIALLSSFTSNGFKEVLYIKCCELGLAPQFYLSDYNQYMQDILDEKSKLYEFNPDLTIVFVDARTVLGE